MGLTKKKEQGVEEHREFEDEEAGRRSDSLFILPLNLGLYCYFIPLISMMF